MRRWRCVARTLILVVLFASSLTASAASIAFGLGILPDVASEAMKILAWVVGIIIGFLLLVSAAVKLMVTPTVEAFNAQNKQWLSEAVAELGRGFDALMDRHVTANDPHPTASDRMHEPLYAADQQILRELADMRRLRDSDSKKLHALVKAHNMAMTTQQAAIDALGCMAHRDPHKTPFPRRETDPDGTDFSDLRGHARKDPMVVEEEEEP